MLTSDRLKTKLLPFCDPSAPDFDGLPATREQARGRWAAAFDYYIAVIEEAIPRPPPPPDSHPSIVLGGVKDAFLSTLALNPVAVAKTAALDFAGAWQAAVVAIKPGGTATDNAGGTYVFAAFANAPALHDALAATLETLFASPTTDVETRIGKIADAFHLATTGLQATVSYTDPSGVTKPTQTGVQ